MPKNPTLMFDTLQGLLDVLSDNHVFAALYRDELDAAREALEDLHRWADAESAAAEINYQKWQEAQRQLDALRYQPRDEVPTIDRS